jgi:hypothetical protein
MLIYQVRMIFTWRSLRDERTSKTSHKSLGVYARTQKEESKLALSFNIQNIWLTLAIWGFIYLSDYYLTIVSAKHHRDYLSEYISYDGSFELTPKFQKDVDGLKLISPQFLVRWFLSILIIYFLWWLSTEVLLLPQFFYFLIGALILREIATHLRHFRNLSVYYFARNGGIKGRIEYSRPFVLKLSAAEFFSFSLVYLAFAFLVNSWFFLGGTLGCLVVAIQHWRLSQKVLASTKGFLDKVKND